MEKKKEIVGGFVHKKKDNFYKISEKTVKETFPVMFMGRKERVK